MVVHNIIDISPLYHRFAYRMRSTGSEIPIMYLVMKEVERMRASVEGRGADVITSACFDSPVSFRKMLVESQDAEQYKSGRHSILTQQDFDDIETMKKILSDTGVNVFCKDGCEADDLMARLANAYKDDFDLTVLYTPDKDMMINIQDSVGMRRYVQGTWNSISDRNFSDEASACFKTLMPYNAIGLYLCTVGDSADHIPGIRKFGSMAFMKMVKRIYGNVDWESLVNYDNVASLLVKCCEDEIISEEQLKQAADSYNMVRTIEIDGNDRDTAEVSDNGYGFKKITTGMKLPSVLSTSTAEKRIAVYTEAGMKSLAK